MPVHLRKTRCQQSYDKGILFIYCLFMSSQLSVVLRGILIHSSMEGQYMYNLSEFSLEPHREWMSGETQGEYGPQIERHAW